MLKNKKIILIAILMFAVLGAGNNTSAERLFQTHSTWYQKIPADQTLNPNSANIISDYDSHSMTLYGNASLNNGDWSYSYWKTTGVEDIITVNITHSNPISKQYMEDMGWNKIPIPAGTVPPGNAASCTGTYRDGVMLIVDEPNNTAWQVEQAKHCSGSSPADPNVPTSGTWTAKVAYKYNLTGTGVRISPDYSNIYIGDSSIYGASRLHGLVRYDEIMAGEIDHALVFHYVGELCGSSGGALVNSACDGGHYGVYPAPAPPYVGASRSGSTATAGRPYAMRMGMRLQLDPTINCANYANPPYNFVQTICTALQDYGMIFEETTSGTNNYILLENLYFHPTKSWSGIYAQGGFPWKLTSFRVIKPLTPPFNNSDTTPPAAPQGVTVQ